MLEGSRLGGTVLKRRVPDGVPTAFLAARNPGAWKELVETLDERLNSAERIAAAADAAVRVFNLFEASALKLIGAASI